MLTYPHKDAVGRDVDYGDLVLTIDMNYSSSGGNFALGIVLGSTPKRLKIASKIYNGNEFRLDIRPRHKIVVVNKEDLISSEWQNRLNELMSVWINAGWNQRTDE